ncbi:MAG: T9SS type A sorting domain-containing protein [Chitinophagaceae bacterium]|nr:T9SS type A sorting domain-containing protein [Chitinophagaceae bacterium]
MSVISGFSQSNDLYCKQVDDIARLEMRAAERKMMAQYLKKTAADLIDVVYYRCDWNIDPAVAQISGTVTSYFTAKSTINQITFDLKSNMVVDKVFQGGWELSFTHVDDKITINLPETLRPTMLDSVTIKYSGTPISSGFGSFVKTTHEGVPVIWTLSEPYGAMDWWPCKNGLDDKVDSIDIYITCPKAYKGISNGIRQSETFSTNGTETRTTHWKHRYPMVSYLVCLAVTNYVEFNDSVKLGNKQLPMQTFCYPESYDLFRNNTQSTLDAMLLFHYTFGDYPFIKEKYGHTQFSWGGGEEHQTNSFVINPGESLCAHELAHQWFGDKITCGSWVDIWLNEGFATHLASMFMENKYPDSATVWRKNEINRITDDPTGSVKVDDTTNVNRIFSYRLSYLKGSHLLYMLRFKLGTEMFLKAARAYQNDEDVAHGFAKTADLKRVFEKTSGVALDSFLRQWYEGQGHPSYDVQWSQIGNTTVRIQMNQTTSHSSVPFFEMPVALKFKNGSQEKTIVVDCKTNGQVFTEQIGFIADTVLIDPEFWLISRNNKSTKQDLVAPNTLNLLVFPNPFEASVTVQIQNFNSPFVDVIIYNMVGQTVFAKQYDLYQGHGYFQIPSSTWASGKYWLKTINQDGTENVISLLKK